MLIPLQAIESQYFSLDFQNLKSVRNYRALDNHFNTSFKSFQYQKHQLIPI